LSAHSDSRVGLAWRHLATDLAAPACAKGHRVRFVRTTELVTALIEARDERSFLRLKGQFAKLDLLVLDELGYVPASKVGSELLFDVISTAYERTRLILTTKLPFDTWTEVLGSERLTGATFDRLTHRCRIIETKGESYRLQGAKARTSRRAKSTTETGTNPPPQAFRQPQCYRSRSSRAVVLDRDLQGGDGGATSGAVDHFHWSRAGVGRAPKAFGRRKTPHHSHRHWRHR
jgi:hypothetical protein